MLPNPFVIKCSDGELQNPPVPKDVMSKLARMEVEVSYRTVPELFIYKSCHAIMMACVECVVMCVVVI